MEDGGNGRRFNLYMKGLIRIVLESCEKDVNKKDAT
jgi:hypothetical protein